MKLLKKYLFRIDDLCEGVDKEKFSKLYSLFKRYNVKGTFAIIPDNQDKSIISSNCFSNEEYLNLINDLVKDKMFIALHGYHHVLKTIKKTEFKNLSYDKQFQKIKIPVIFPGIPALNEII